MVYVTIFLGYNPFGNNLGLCLHFHVCSGLVVRSQNLKLTLIISLKFHALAQVLRKAATDLLLCSTNVLLYETLTKRYGIYIVARMCRLYKTGIGLTTGFIRHSYSYT
jgi:hypothetical protein